MNFVTTFKVFERLDSLFDALSSNVLKREFSSKSFLYVVVNGDNFLAG